MYKRILCKWKSDLDNQYLSSFKIGNIFFNQQQFATIISNIDHLYTNMKSIQEMREINGDGMEEKYGLIMKVNYYVRNSYHNDHILMIVCLLSIALKLTHNV